jgi:hypothetical protein
MPETVAPSHFPLAALLWPHRADGPLGLLRSVILVALGTALLTLSANRPRRRNTIDSVGQRILATRDGLAHA